MDRNTQAGANRDGGALGDPADLVREGGWSAPYGGGDPSDDVIEGVVGAVPAHRWETLRDAVADYRRVSVAYEWAGGEVTSEVIDAELRNVHHLGYVNYDSSVLRIGELVAEMGLLVPCSASDWLPPDEDGLHELRVAPMADVLRRLSSAIRSDRFMEGTLADAIDAGAFDVLLERLLDYPTQADVVASWLDPRLQVVWDSRRVARYRLLQSWYRNQRLHARFGGAARPVGSMLHEDEVEARLELNFLNEAAYRHAVARSHEVQAEGGTLEVGRLRHNMLSSMPLCFNIFGALGDEPAFIDLIRLVDPEASSVVEVVCENKPTDSLGDRTAFDAFVVYLTSTGGRRFLGVETKYTEAFSPKPYQKDRYTEVTRSCGWFRPGAETALFRSATNQLWRNLMLAACTERDGDYDFGRVLVLTTADDQTAFTAVAKAREQLIDPDQRLGHLRYNDLVAGARTTGSPALARWADKFNARYLDLSPVRPFLQRATPVQSSLR